MIRIGSLALALGVALSAFATPAAAQTKQKVTLAGAPVALPHWFPIYVAAAKFFDEEGLEADWVGLNSGAAQLAAIMGGSATVAPTGIEHIINSYAEGGDIVAFTTLFDAQPNSVVLSKEAMAKAGITESMPLDEKIKRMRGLKIGITGAGGGSDLYFRAILKNRGIEPDQFLTLQPLGNPNAMYGAFEKKLVDGFVMSAPIDDKAAASGIGVIAINALTGEVPEVKGVPYTGMLTTRRQLDANRPLYVKITRAVTKAIKYIKENPEGTREVWKPLISQCRSRRVRHHHEEVHGRFGDEPGHHPRAICQGPVLVQGIDRQRRAAALREGHRHVDGDGGRGHHHEGQELTRPRVGRR